MLATSLLAGAVSEFERHASSPESPPSTWQQPSHSALLRIPKSQRFRRPISRKVTSKVDRPQAHARGEAFSADVVANVLDKCSWARAPRAGTGHREAERNKAFREGSYGACAA